MSKKFDVGYDTAEKKRGIEDWIGKTISTAVVEHMDGDGVLTVKFTDGTTKTYGFNELGFWEKE